MRAKIRRLNSVRSYLSGFVRIPLQEGREVTYRRTSSSKEKQAKQWNHDQELNNAPYKASLAVRAPREQENATRSVLDPGAAFPLFPAGQNGAPATQIDDVSHNRRLSPETTRYRRKHRCYNKNTPSACPHTIDHISATHPHLFLAFHVLAHNARKEWHDVSTNLYRHELEVHTEQLHHST